MKALTLRTSVGHLAANLYMPRTETMEKPPLVIVTGAWTTVKEQMPAVYANAIVTQGYAALTFDFRGWGKSTGWIKYLEDPARKIEDIRAVIDAASQLEQIDSNRIFGLGICASTGYMLDAASGNSKITAVAAVAPWIHNREIANTVYGGEAAVDNLIELGQEAASTGTVFIEAASNENDKSLMYQAPYYTETDRGKIPEYDNLFNVASWKPWLTYDAIRGATTQDKPVLFVASEAMALPAGTHQYLEQSSDNVSAIWLEGVTQFDFYDVPEHVNRAADAVIEHFARTR